jgi:hypothetical protein
MPEHGPSDGFQRSFTFVLNGWFVLNIRSVFNGWSMCIGQPMCNV